MTVGELIDYLSTRSRDQLVVLAKDAEDGRGGRFPQRAPVRRCRRCRCALGVGSLTFAGTVRRCVSH